MIEWVPTESEDVTTVATPPLKKAAPIVVTPSRKVTDPFGIPLPGGTAEVVAVKVTCWPDPEGLRLTAIAVLLDAWFTVWLTPGETAGACVASPGYCAVRVWLPTERLPAFRVAWPALIVDDPMRVTPS